MGILLQNVFQRRFANKEILVFEQIFVLRIGFGYQSMFLLVVSTGVANVAVEVVEEIRIGEGFFALFASQFRFVGVGKMVLQNSARLLRQRLFRLRYGTKRQS